MKIGSALTLAGFSFMVALAGSIFVGTRIVEAHTTIGLSSFENALQNGRTPTMSHSSISTLLTRNLQDVFGENDRKRRRSAIDEIYTEDVVFYESGKSVYRGRDEIDRVAGALRTQHPDFRYQVITAPEELGDGGRIQWLEGRPGQAPVVAGTDFIIARDGRIAAIYFFFDKLPLAGQR
jgi:SnoaL-like domain